MTDIDIIRDLRRELEKAREALIGAQSHLASHAEANAALHCATTVMYSPLHAKVTAAIGQIEHALQRTEGALTAPPSEEQRQHIPASELADRIEKALRTVPIRLGPNARAMLDRGEAVCLSGGEYADMALTVAMHLTEEPTP